MADKIKTRTVQKNIKVLDKSVSTLDRMQRKTRETADSTARQDGEETPVSYAENRISGGTREVVGEGTRQIYRQGKRVAGKIKTREQQETSAFFSAGGQADETGEGNLAENRKKKPAGENITKKQASTFSKTSGAEESPKVSDNHSGTGKIKTREMPSASGIREKRVKKGNIKQNTRTIKTSVYTKKTVVKTSGYSVKASKQVAAKAAKDAKKSAQAARKTEKEVRRMTKAAVRAVKNAVRRLILATKSLITLIASGGGVAVAIILLIMLIGIVVSSPFGIFFSGESNTKDGQTMSEVVAEINGEYQTKIEEIKKKNKHDVLEMSGAKAAWREVLSVYAVKTNTDTENPQEVATIDENKKEILRTIFWELNIISSKTEKKKETVTEMKDDGKGNMIKEEKKVERVYLYITVTHKSASEMAEQYAFNHSQKDQLAELLAEKNADMWAAVLYGITNGTGNGDIVEVARSQLGNEGGEPYWSWYGFTSRVSWCACFVSWCADQCGYLESGVIPKFSLCTDGVNWYKNHGQWQNRGYSPAPGEIIFFDWDGDNAADHVGIVEKTEKGVVYTIEGNTSDACKQHSYSAGSGKILGYGVPRY